MAKHLLESSKKSQTKSRSPNKTQAQTKPRAKLKTSKISQTNQLVKHKHLTNVRKAQSKRPKKTHITSLNTNEQKNKKRYRKLLLGLCRRSKRRSPMDGTTGMRFGWWRVKSHRVFGRDVLFFSFDACFFLGGLNF